MTLHPSDIAMSAWCIFISIGGLLSNACIFVVILSSKELRNKDYICFILNRSILDFVYCVLLGALHPWAILTESTFLCKTAAFLEVSMVMSTIFLEPMLACNRYVSIFYRVQHKKIYTIRNVIIICICIWIAGIFCAIPHAIKGSLGRTTGIICCVTLSRDSVIVMLLANYVPVFLGMATVGCFNYKIYQFLRKHQSQQMTNSQRTKLQSDQEMLKFIIVAALLPVVIQAPVVTATWIHMFNPLSGWILFGSIALFLCMFLINPLVTLYMVRPLRNRFKRLVGRLIGKESVVSNVVESYGGALSTVQPGSTLKGVVRVD